jgi:hypothetical protein
VRAGVKDEREDVKVERVEDPLAVKGQIAKADSPAELDAEARATEALAVQRDWQPDLSGVDLHEGPDAAEKAASIGAAAFTQGNDVYLGADVERGTPQGDHVLAHELAHVEQRHGSEDIHRYPATALSAGPVGWSNETASVFRPGGGISGGVYILTSSTPEGGVEKVVAKPIFGASGLGTKESGESLVAGDRALSMIGVKTPTSRVAKGAEAAELANVVASEAPKKPVLQEGATRAQQDEVEMWKPITDAKSFVVMGEVPGKSVASLAEKAAGGDKESMNSLYRSVLDDDFVAEMGRASVGDLLIGNNDRMVGGAMNLGNIMVEMTEGRSKMWAIDTNAVLGKKFDPRTVVAKGTTSSSLQGGFEHARNDLAAGGAKTRIEGFFGILVDRMKAASGPKPEGDEGLSAVELFEQAVARQLPRLVESFERGWDAALVDVFALLNTKEGRAKMKTVTDVGEGTDSEDDLDYTALKLNAMYLAGKAEGKEDAENANDVGAQAAVKQLAGFDPNSIGIPVDQFHHDQAPLPSSDAYTADLEHPTSLGPPSKIVDVMKVKGKSYDPAKLTTLGQSAENAKIEMAQLGNKSRGVVKKKEQPRNRTLAGIFVANSYQVGGGALRAVASAFELSQLVDAIAIGVGGNLKPSQAQAMLPAARFAKSYAMLLEQHMQSYARALSDEAKGIGKMKKYDMRGEVTKQLTLVAGNVNENKERLLRGLEKKNPQALVDALTEAAKKKK